MKKSKNSQETNQKNCLFMRTCRHTWLSIGGLKGLLKWVFFKEIPGK